MNIQTQLIYFENWILRIRPPQGQGQRILLMLHGWQGDENSMWVFAHKFPADYWIVAPRALHLAPQGGYSWSMPGAGWPSVDLLRPAAAALLDLLDSWPRANGLDGSRVDIIGFSQGAAMAFTMAMLYPNRVRKLGILSGFAPDATEQVLTPNRLNGIQAFVAHGVKDERIPVAQAQRSIQLLEMAGAQVTYSESNMAHKLGVESLRLLETYLS